jgi:hypothetical protein
MVRDKSNATAMAGFSDPGGNFVFEIHQYLDDDSSGSKDSCVSVTIGRERLKGVTRWMREQRAQAILGEFGVPRNPLCLAALDDLMSFWREWRRMGRLELLGWRRLVGGISAHRSARQERTGATASGHTPPPRGQVTHGAEEQAVASGRRTGS